VWYREPRLTSDPELKALSPFCMDLYTLQAVRKRVAKVEGFSDQSE
jgi:hypothetical protein